MTARGKALSSFDRGIWALLHPESVAVVGASDNAGNPGGILVGLLARFDYPGPLWPAHPRGATVAGRRCYPALKDLPGIPNVVAIAPGAERVDDMVDECIGL